MLISTQQISGWARTGNHLQTPNQSLSRPWAAAHGASSPGVFRQPLCLGIFCLSTDACHLVQRSIHSAISAVNTYGPGVQTSHVKVVSKSLAWEPST